MFFSRQPNGVKFKCNICDQINHAPIEKLSREEASCTGCGSTVRMRSIVQVLTTELFGKSMTISEIGRPRPDITGIGMSCWNEYVSRLSHKINYKNTYYHQEPFFDVTKEDPALFGTLDFVVSTDVFEHVAPPVDRAFINVKKILKPDGVFVFSVPYKHDGEKGIPTKEHFPDLHDYRIINQDGKYILENITRSGEKQVFDDLIFHGGPGETLEMRVFTEWSIVEELKNAGFNDITFYLKDDLKHGIRWPTKRSATLAARHRKDWEQIEFSVRIR